jgi:tetratricopeptide (TPR) repeat protein
MARKRYYRALLYGSSAIVALAIAALTILWVSRTWAVLSRMPEYELRAAKLALEEFDFDQAMPHVEQVLSVRPDWSEALSLAAQTTRRLGDVDRANGYLADWEHRHGVTAASARERALLRAQTGELAEVEPGLRDLIVRHDPDAPLILEALARGEMKAHQLPAARETLSALLKQQPRHYRAWIWRGEVNGQESYRHDALADYQHALDLKPESDDARRHLAGMLQLLGRIQEAALQCELLHKKNPADVAVTVSLARCRQDLHELDKAEHLLDELLARGNEPASALAERGRLALRQGNPGSAEKFLRRAVTAAPKDKDALFVLAICLEAQGKGEEARVYKERGLQVETCLVRAQQLIKGVTEATHDAELRYRIGMLLQGGGENADAVDWLKSALFDNPRHAKAQAALESLSAERVSGERGRLD